MASVTRRLAFNHYVHVKDKRYGYLALMAHIQCWRVEGFRGQFVAFDAEGIRGIGATKHEIGTGSFFDFLSERVQSEYDLDPRIS